MWGKRKRISVTYLRNKKFPVNTTPPAADAASALLFGSGVGNLQRRLLSSKARGICFLLPTAVNIGLLLLSLCSTVVQLCRAFWGRKMNTKRAFRIIYLSHFSLIFSF